MDGGRGIVELFNYIIYVDQMLNQVTKRHTLAHNASE